MILWLLSGCSGADNTEITLALSAHSLASCPLPGPARLDLSALGDFPISNRTSESLGIDAVGTQLTFPATTLALEATANADLAPQPFIGFTERAVDRLDFLLWPQGTACDVFRPSAGDSFPGKLGGEALGFSASSGLVVVAGSNDSSSAAIVGALTFDVRTGASYVVDPRKREVLSEPRAFATVSDFAGKVLVAGGENPIHDSSQPAGALRDTAEVYDPASQSFEPALIPLAEATTRHAAAALEDGETVLIGGRDEASNASSTVQVVSPVTRISKLVGSLTVGRASPVALRLSSGRVLVAGGEDADGHPIGALELRDTDASKLDSPWDDSIALPSRFDRAFAAMPGDAVLAVGGCEDRPAAPGEDCSIWCDRGCPPTPDVTTQQTYDAFWLTADGGITPLAFPLSAPRPILVAGSDGRPWLIASDVDQANQPVPRSFALYRFDPWQKRFDAVDADLGFNDTLSRSRLVATGPDAFAWLGADAAGPVLRGVRLGTRSAFTSDVPLVSLRDAGSRPAHLAPDHPPGDQASYDAQSGVLQFSPLASGTAPTCVWVSDAEYGDFSAQIAFSSAVAPTLRLGPEIIADPNSSTASGPCRLPAASTPNRSTCPAGTTCITMHRTGDHLALATGAATNSCTLDSVAPLARVPLGVCQSDLGAVTVTQLSVTRGD